jgi:translation initiation factor IF-2
MAKIKKVENFLGQATEKATFSSPVRVFGFCTLPKVGEPFVSFANKKDAEKYLVTNLDKKTSSSTDTTHENVAGQVEIPLVIKTDVAGTLEALEKEALKVETDKVKLKIVHTGVGAVSENDIKMAGSNCQAVVIGFNVKTDRAAIDLAEKNGTVIITFDIIYKLSEWLAEEVTRRTPKETVEEEIGRAKIIRVFSQAKDKQIIGGQVTTGTIVKGKPAKILRRDEEIGRGYIIALQEQKIKTSQVAEGVQFGCEFDAKIQLAPGDVIVAFDAVIR